MGCEITNNNVIIKQKRIQHTSRVFWRLACRQSVFGRSRFFSFYPDIDLQLPFLWWCWRASAPVGYIQFYCNQPTKLSLVESHWRRQSIRQKTRHAYVIPWFVRFTKIFDDKMAISLSFLSPNISINLGSTPDSNIISSFVSDITCVYSFVYSVVCSVSYCL